MEIQIVLTQGKDWFSRLIVKLGLAEWTHAAIRLRYYASMLPDDYDVIEAGFLAGVQRRRWNPNEYLRYKVFRLKGEHDPLVYEKMLSFALGQVGKRYAYDDLAIVAFRLLKQALIQAALIPIGFVGEGEVCTSLVSKIYEHGGFDLRDDIDSHLLTPDDIDASKILEVVEEGP